MSQFICDSAPTECLMPLEDKEGTMLTPQMSRKDIAYLTTLLANVQQDLRELKERI